MAKQLEEVRTHLTNELGLQEPPNLELGLYYNSSVMGMTLHLTSPRCQTQAQKGNASAHLKS